MKTINYYTKKGRQMTSNYLGAQFTELYQVYDRYSFNKQTAYEWCKYEMAKEKGTEFKIISWNKFQFTCGWRNSQGIRIETRDTSYQIINLPF